MSGIGPVEILVLKVLAALIVYFALRRRVPTGVLILLIIELSPSVAVSLALIPGTIFSAIPVSLR